MLTIGYEINRVVFRNIYCYFGRKNYKSAQFFSQNLTGGLNHKTKCIKELRDFLFQNKLFIPQQNPRNKQKKTFNYFQFEIEKVFDGKDSCVFTQNNVK